MVKFTFLVTEPNKEEIEVTIRASGKLEAFAKIKDMYPDCGVKLINY